METNPFDRKLRQLMGEMVAAAPESPELAAGRRVDASTIGQPRRWPALAAVAAVLVIALVGAVVVRGASDTTEVSSGEFLAEATSTSSDETADVPVSSGAAVVIDSDGRPVFTVGEPDPSGVDPWIVEQVESELLSDVVWLSESMPERQRMIAEDGLVVRLALDAGFTTRAQTAFADLPAELDAVALIVDNATGQVVTATSRSGTSLGLAQPAGSARLAIYAAALEAGETLESMVDGTGPCSVELDGETRTLENYGNATGGVNTLLDQATRASRCGEARLEARTGDDANHVLARLTDAEIDGRVTDVPQLTAFEHIGTALAPATDGVAPIIGLVSAIVTADGHELFRRGLNMRRVMDVETARDLMELMVVNVERGTGTRAGLEGRLAAGLTGTDPEFRAAWFVGTADGFTSAVWLALPDGSPMTDVGDRIVTGGSYPAQVWARLFPQRPNDRSTTAPVCPQGYSPVDLTGDGVADECHPQPDDANESDCPSGFPVGVDTTGDGIVDTCYADGSSPPEPNVAAEGDCPSGFPVGVDTTGDGVVDTCYAFPPPGSEGG